MRLLAVKFTIEIYTKTPDGAETILLKTTVNALSPLTAQKAVTRLLNARKTAKVARVLNAQGELIYQIE